MNPDYTLILDYLSSLSFNPVFQEILECFTRPSLLEFSYQFAYPIPRRVTLQVPIPTLEGVTTPNGSRVKNGMVIYETRWEDYRRFQENESQINYILKLSFDPRGWILSCMIDDGYAAISEYAEIYSRDQSLVSSDRRPFGNLSRYRPILRRIENSIL